MSQVKVTILGCGDAFGSGGRYHACFHIAAGSAQFLLDCGASSLVRNHLDYRTLMAHRGKLDCRRLVLTHMGEEMLARLGKVEAECAEDGKQIIL